MPLLQPAVRWVLALALLLPMLLALLPSPVSAQDAALYRDLQVSRCLEQGVPLPDEHRGCDACVLCGSCCLPQAQAEFDLLVVLSPVVQTAKVSFVFEHLNRAALAAITGPDPGRGPPA